MPLSGQEFDQLHKALISAFPDEESLTLLIRTGLNENLNLIAGTGPGSGTVTSLLIWAESQGRDGELVTQAYLRNSGNPSLRAFVQNASHLVNWETLQRAGMRDKDLFLPDAREPATAVRGVSGKGSSIRLPHSTPSDWDVPGGIMHENSRVYIERWADSRALKEIRKQGTTIVIKGPHQVGKSSLSHRIQIAAEQANKMIAQVDLQLFDSADLKDADSFYRQFCFVVTEAIGLVDQRENYWKAPGMNFKCTQYFERYILAELEKQKKTVVLALDEAERIQDADFSSDFYGMLRSWHGLRSSKSRWKRLDMVLVTTRPPSRLINIPTQSPFNVGLVLELEDFSREQAEELFGLYQATELKNRSEELWNLLEGHPYLTQCALYVVNEGYQVDRLFTAAIQHAGPFGDHLEHLHSCLHGQEKLIAGLHQVIEQNTCQDLETLSHLRSLGLVREMDRNRVKPRCQLYADYFRAHLHG